MNVYFIPGLGADKRIFRNIRLPAGCEPHYLDWIPHRKKESLRDYSLRIAENIDVSKPFTIVGLSFGGMLAAEIVSTFSTGKMVIISSVPRAIELPVYYRFAGKIGLHRLLPVSLFKSASLMKRLFTAETPEQKAYLKMMIRQVDTSFIRWAIDAIVKWKGGVNNTEYIHIHGSRDEVLPSTFCKPTHLIRGGGHLMILTRAGEINDILKSYLSAS
jgi:pimeloyl-ACP methyl ester carboxylesterase